MNSPENVPSAGKQQPSLSKHGLTPAEIQAMRQRIQAGLNAQKPEKEAEERLEKHTYSIFKPYIIPEPLKVCNELYGYGVRIDGFDLDVKAAQEAYKKRNKVLPVYPGTSANITEMIKRKEVAYKKGSLSILKVNNAMILSSDGKYFQIHFFPHKESMFFVEYDNDYFK